MAVTTTKTNKPLNPRGNDQSPKGYNRAELYSGKALDFDGVNDVLTTANNLPFSSGDDLSIVSYFKIDDSNEGYFYQNSAIYLAVYRDGSTSVGELSAYVSNGWLDTGYIVNDSKWYQVAQIVDNGTQRIYLNGQEIATQSGVSYNPGSQTVLNIGKRASNYLNGQMANLKAFNVALTAAQVADLYNNPEKIVPTGVADSALKLWLPMQEGAGTTAYDGSGNGNHGTISGATWTHGVGAPVSQTAVIDWNKGQNLFTYSEDFSQTAWTKDSVTLTADDTTAPDGSDTAEKVEASASNAYIQQTKSGLDTSASYTLSVWAKTDSGTADFQIGNVDVSNYVTKTASTEWQRFEVTQTPSAATRYPRIFRTSTSDAVTIYLWGAQLEKVSSAGAYIPNHTGTPITSDVLLPQGLTTGRDITGVNLFENVRKQGALNLDGNSWAEVHDNASLDITDAITLEAWVYWGDGSNMGILGRWVTNGNKRSYLLYKLNDNNVSFYISSDGTGTNQDLVPFNVTVSDGWQHIVGVYDGSNLKSYLNGSLTNTVATSLTEIDANEKKIEIGRYNGSLAQSYPNDIAQPRIYNRALSAEEVQRNYDAGKNIYTND